jgi:sugar diacid utilization regulator
MQESENFRPADCDVPTDAPPLRGPSARDEAIRAIARRVAGREEELARQIVARCREEIVDYRAGDDSLSADATGLALDNVRALLANLERGAPVSNGQLERTRMGAARRVHQGVSLESYLHGVRLWGQVAWETLRAAARGDRPDEREAALEIASRVMRHVDLASTAGAHAYLHEAQGLSNYGHLLQRDLLEALLGGEHDPNRARRRAHSLGLRLAENYVVLVIRPQEMPPRGTEGQPLASRATVRHMIEVARTHLRPPSGALLLGLRDAEVVALYPIAEPAQVHTAKQDAGSLAGAVAPSRLSVGMSGWQPGLAGIPLSYGEAREAAQIAAGSGITGRAVTLDEVLIDHIARFTPHVGRVLDETLHPLVEYDLAHGTALVPTVAAYVDAGFNLTRSAEVLHVHPNTVMYRLRRVKELCGRDPHDPDDLLILFLALKLAELSPGP